MNPPGEWTCEEVANLIHAYAFGRLNGGEAASVEHHLRGCARCGSIMAEIGHDTAEVLEATGLRDLPEDLIDLIIAAAAQQGMGRETSSTPARSSATAPVVVPGVAFPG